MDWDTVAREVHEGLTEVGQVAQLVSRTLVGAGPNAVPQSETSTPITVVKTNQLVRDPDGSLTGRTRRVLLISATDALTVSKGDYVDIGGEKLEISEIVEVSPGSGTVLWKVMTGV